VLIFILNNFIFLFPIFEAISSTIVLKKYLLMLNTQIICHIY